MKAVRSAFLERLRHALDEVHPEEWGRQSWLAEKMHVKPQMASKYLNGESMPKDARMQSMADALNVSVTWLRDGAGAKRAPISDPLLIELETVWRSLQPEDRVAVLDFARYRLDRSGGSESGSSPVEANQLKR